MVDEKKPQGQLEIAHVLFMDVVGYSKLLVDEQGEVLHELNGLVLGTEAVREAEASGSLVRLPTGDGMALVFSSSVEAPVNCALQLSQALQAQPNLPLRMGIHSGPIQRVADVNGRENIAGSGINIAQRVMDCGDAGHILVSKRVADDLAGSRRWQPYLHEVGDVEVKHGLVVSLVNLYADAVGNPSPPSRFGVAKATRRRPLVPFAAARVGIRTWLLGLGALLVLAVAAFVLWRQRSVINAETKPKALPAPTAAPAPAAETADKSVAVLPFANLSADKDNEFFADGVQDEVLTDLAKVADLKVISRTSVMQYRDANRNLSEVARALGVAYVVEGSVQRAGNKIRVTAQLIDARTDAHKWADKYDRDLADVFAIQSEIAQAIAGQLQAAISPQEQKAMTEAPTHDVEAYALYLRAVEITSDYDRQDWRGVYEQALALLEAATTRDPQFVRAHAYAAFIQALKYRNYETTEAQAGVARDAAATVARLRPDSGEAHAAQGTYDYYVPRDYAQARVEYEAALRLLPNDAGIWARLAVTDCRQGRWTDALARIRRTSDLDPNSTEAFNMEWFILNALRRYPEALAVLERPAARRQPWFARNLRTIILLAWKADVAGAQAELATVPADYDPEGLTTQQRLYCDGCARDFAAAGRDLAACPLAELAADFSGPSVPSVPRGYYEGLLAHWRGDQAAAGRALTPVRAALEASVRAEPGRADLLMVLACTDAALGRREDALSEGRRAIAARPPEHDAMDGPGLATAFARVLAWTGERDEAIRTLQVLAARPNGPDYGYLKLHPDWDALRSDPRFEALCRELAPAVK